MSTDDIGVDPTPPPAEEPGDIEQDALPGAPTPKATPPKRVRPPRATVRAKRVDIKAGMVNLYTTAAVGVAMIPNGQPVGLAMAAAAEDCGSAWAALADENPGVRRALEKVLGVTGIGILIAAHIPIVVAIMVATGAMPPAVAALLDKDKKESGT